MGNSAQPDKNLKIYIETQKPYYNSGSSIQGAVFVQTLQNFHFDALYLRVQGIVSAIFSGNQWCQWFQGSSKNRRKYTGQQNFYAIEHILYKYQQKYLPQGKYVYPFSLELSDNIPGSFDSSELNAKIQYNMMAYFVNYQKPDETQIYEKPLMIRQPFRQDIFKYNGKAASNPKKFGLITCGQIQLEVNFDKNVAFEGEQIQISLDVNNSRGTEDISKLKAELVQHTFVSSNGNASRKYRKSIKAVSLNERVRIGQTKKQIYFNFKIPAIVYQTAISTLVANYYTVEVSADLGMTTSSVPCVFAPIFILKKNLEQKGHAATKDMKINEDFHVAKPVCIRSGQYSFKKNRNLQVFNFRSEDLVTQSAYGSESAFH